MKAKGETHWRPAAKAWAGAGASDGPPTEVQELAVSGPPTEGHWQVSTGPPTEGHCQVSTGPPTEGHWQVLGLILRPGLVAWLWLRPGLGARLWTGSSLSRWGHFVGQPGSTKRGN